jgi:RalA-binding protein 1
VPYIDSQTLAGDVDLLNDEEYWDPHAVAGLLKTYFRELPTTILTHERHFRFLKVIGTLFHL